MILYDTVVRIGINQMKLGYSSMVTYLLFLIVLCIIQYDSYNRRQLVLRRECGFETSASVMHGQQKRYSIGAIITHLNSTCVALPAASTTPRKDAYL